MLRIAAAFIALFATTSSAMAESGPTGSICIGFGPQTPRDIDRKSGANAVRFATAPASTEMDLCNIHLHESAEHKAAAYSIYAGPGDGHGFGSGYKCAMGESLTEAERKPTAEPICAGEHGDLKPGDTIEVHWVYSSCEVTPGPTLGACLSESCNNPQLRVEAQVFTLVNDPNAANFASFGYDGGLKAGRHQPASLPVGTGTPVTFMGSTTGPSYDAAKCSPFQVTWSVRPQCAKLDINSLGRFCKGNVFKEDHAHGVRTLVVEPSLLSWIE